MKDSPFKVVIVGGGIGGLALANSLQHTGIDWVLVEKGKELDPQVGASIGILPNGARLLDQFGCFDDLVEWTVQMETTATHKADGSLIGDISDTLRLMERRTGYPVFFLDRQLLLRTLARRIKSPEKVLLETVAKDIEQHDDRTVVRCEDGTTIEADVVVGSDGVHSFVRREMWRHADLAGEGEQFNRDKKAMSAEYKCLFGISNSISGMQPGQTDRTYARGLSTLSYVGKGGRVFWFIFIKMDKVYYPPHIPKFTSDDVETLIHEIGNLALRQEGKVTVADIYKARVVCNLVAVEEAKYEQWSYGRLVCMGDAIHKMTPNLGAGASSAIESAAVLSNVLVSAIAHSSTPSLSEIRSCFKEYQKERTLRVERAMGTTNKLTRIQALETTKDYIISHYIAPHMDDAFAESFSSFVIGAPVVDHLPIPARSVQGTMPFNPKQGWGYEELTSARLKRAWPLIAMTLISLLSSSKYIGGLSPYANNTSAGHTTPLFTNYVKQDIARQAYALSISSDVTYGLWLIEAARLNNKSTLVQFPLLFGLAWQYFGYGSTIPLYFLLLYTQSPIERFRAADNRLTDVSYISSIAPLILLLGVVPKTLEYASVVFGQGDVKGFIDNSSSIFSQQFIPSWTLLLLLSSIQFLIARVIRQSTVRSDRLWAVHRDVKTIRYTTSLLASLTSISWVLYMFDSRKVMASIVTSLSLKNALWYVFLGKNGALLTLSATMWLVLAFRDLRNAGMIATNWLKIGVLGLVTLSCFGPGSLLVIGWQWREEILLNRKHRHAVVKPEPNKSK